MTLNYRNERDLNSFIDLNKPLKNKITNNEEAFNAVINWINNKLSEKSLHIFTISDYSEYIMNTELKRNNTKGFNKETEKNFYLRSGELLALFYILNIKNLNSENIICMGEHPIIINSKIRFNSNSSNQLFSANEAANFIIEYSTYNINFLPKDKIRSAEKYIYYIKEGFSLIYNIVIEHKGELLYLINTFSEDKKFSLSATILRIQSLNLNDMKKQLFFINQKFLQNSDYKISIKFSEDKIFKDINKLKLKSMVCKIGDYIIERSIIGYKDSKLERTWIDVSEDGTIKSMDSSLYRGNSGVALFLVYLGGITDKQYFTFAALEAIYPVLRDIQQNGIDKFTRLDTIAVLYILLNVYKVTCDNKVKEFIDDNLYTLFKVLKNDKIFAQFYNNHIFDKSECLNIIKSECLKNSFEKVLHLEINLYNKDEDELFFRLSSILFMKLRMKSTCPNNVLLDKEIEKLIKYIVSKGTCNNIYYICGNLVLLNYTADILNNTSLKNMVINSFNLVVENVLENYKSKKFNLFEQRTSFINGLSGLGYNLLNFINNMD